MSRGFLRIYLFFLSRFIANAEIRAHGSCNNKLLHSSSHRDVLAQKWPPSADAIRRTPVGLCAESVRRGRRSLSHIFTRTYTHMEVHQKETRRKTKKRRHESTGERVKLGYVLGCCEYQAPLGLPYR